MHKNWTALIKPHKVKFSEADNQYKVSLVLEPLERGFGTTLGNALRRVLISSLEGAAISSVKIEGAVHEFATIPSVMEDVTDLLLNLKEVVIRMESGTTQTVTLQAEKPGVVTAGDIACGRDIQILNPKHHIATISKGGKLDVVMTVASGKGYVRAMPMSDDQNGVISLDCSFNPVKNVTYKVSNARVGQQTDYDRLVLDIETNGVISPMVALDLAAKILQEQLNVFINFEDTDLPEESDESELSKWDLNLFRKVEQLDLSVRAANCFKSVDVLYVGDLVQKSESNLLKTPNFGRKSLIEIINVLGGMGLTLNMHLEGWPPENAKEIAQQFEEENYV